MSLTPRQQEIVHKSVGLIANRGIQSLTIKNIAKELGITEPAIYRHFDSKFAILVAVLDSFEEISAVVLDDITTADNCGLENIGAFISDRLKRMAANPQMAKVMFSEELFQDDQRLADKMLAIMHGHKHKIQQFILDGQASGAIRRDVEPTIMFRLIFGPLRLLVKQWAMSGYRFDLREEGRAMWTAQRKLIIGEQAA